MADDPNLKNDDSGNAAANDDDASNLVIPDDIAQQYPELLEMVKASRSMNDEERQYWIDALAIMSEDQVKNLYNILDNERKQVQAAEENYKKSSAKKKPAVAYDSQAYKEKKRARLEAERRFEQEEELREQSLLEQLAAL